MKNRFGLIGRDGDVNVLAGWDYVLDAAGISQRDVDAVAFGFNPSAIYQDGAFDVRHEQHHQERVFVQQALLLHALRRRGWRGKTYYVRHHLAHAASVYLCSPYEAAAIITVDGWGESETISVCRGSGNQIRTIAAVPLPNSIGEIYTRLTTKLGWGMDDAGKTMALAAYGTRPANSPRLVVSSMTDDLHIDSSRALEFVESLPIRTAAEPLGKIHIDAAAYIQNELETVMLSLAEWAYRKTGCADLCLSGGVALNCVANGRLQKESKFRSVFAQPACGDSGIPMGAALTIHYHLNPTAPRYVLREPYLGKPYSREDYACALSGHTSREYSDSHSLNAVVANLLAAGKVVARFSDKSELGPRALGNRSILADPRRKEMRDRLNLVVKRRESFRPFAPSVLAEYATKYFDIEGASPFMLMASRIRADRYDAIPAVAHVDGTARIQTVARENNASFYDLIDEFRLATGVPLLINTSFNVAGEPMVESPDQAVQCFDAADLDALALGLFLVERRDARRRDSARGISGPYNGR